MIQWLKKALGLGGGVGASTQKRIGLKLEGQPDSREIIVGDELSLHRLKAESSCRGTPT